MTIDYARMQKSGPRLKAQLTRATRKQDPIDRYYAVLAACRAAVKEWNEVGAWVDAWSNWQRALDDAAHAVARAKGETFFAPRLETL